MQITVTVQPFYAKDFEGSFPKLARRLNDLCPDIISPEPSLYELAGQIDKLLYRTEGSHLREVLLRRKNDLKTIYKDAQEHIAGRNLSGADKSLYRIEDIFEDIESELTT